jgi:hypothetical protein
MSKKVRKQPKILIDAISTPRTLKNHIDLKRASNLTNVTHEGNGGTYLESIPSVDYSNTELQPSLIQQ